MTNGATGKTVMVFQRDISCHHKLIAKHSLLEKTVFENLQKCMLTGRQFLDRFHGVEPTVTERRKACKQVTNQMALPFFQLRQIVQEIHSSKSKKVRQTPAAAQFLDMCSTSAKAYVDEETSVEDCVRTIVNYCDNVGAFKGQQSNSMACPVKKKKDAP